MSPKTLRVDGITNELEGASLYFNPPSKPIPLPSTPASPDIPAAIPEQPSSFKSPNEDDRLPKHASMHASKHEHTHESMHECTHASKHARMHADQHATVNESLHDRMPPNHPAGLLENRGGVQPGTHERIHSNQQNDYIETIRISVKKVGREELYVRIPPEGKNELRSVVNRFNELYRGKGGKTSENEISRIALEFLLGDYKTNGENSILFIIQEALHA
jgi:hypothetical protein